MFEALIYAFMMGLSVIGIVTVGLYVVLRLYSPRGGGRYIIPMDENITKGEIADKICKANLVRSIAGSTNDIPVIIVDCKMGEDNRSFVLSLCREYTNFRLINRHELDENIF